MASPSNTYQKHTIQLEVGQYAQLQENYPDIGAAKIIRALIRAHLEQCSPKIPDDAITTETEL